MKLAQAEFAACTIIARNYLPMARALAESWNALHPEFPFFVLLLDSPQGFFQPASEPFHTVLTSELDIPNLDGFLFKYTVLEASTAVKPYLIGHLFRKYSIRKLLYLDPDILVYKRLDPLREALDNANVLLTPHLLSPLPDDGCGLNDHDILQAGTYNLGFLGIRNSTESKALLRWWCSKLYHHCIVSFKDNLFVDQRWMDMTPGLFDGVQILRDPGFNVAYWNLHERTISVGETVAVNGSPLYFFHFSGFDPNKPWVVSKYQNRFDMKTIGDARKLYSQYRDLLVEKGWEETSTWPYGHDYFTNGVKIPPSARQYYWSLGPDVAHLRNPFSWLSDSDDELAYGLQRQESAPLPAGINLLGYFNSEKGVGECARSALRIIRTSGANYCVNNIVDSGSSNVERVREELRTDNPYRVNLIALNGDGYYDFATRNPSYFTKHFNIGYWVWELPEFPPEWAPAFDDADEIWTCSQFARDSIASRSPIPVRAFPLALEFDDDVRLAADRNAYGISNDVFLFLFFFDFHSSLERKNPLGLVQAYKKAFGNRPDVQLLIKSSHSAEHQRELRLLQEACAGTNVKILDAVLTREEKQGLMKAADSYVSLHRAEGFGLTMAEAMLYGKPVIATGYSGNLDFMSADDSFLVPYKLVTIQETHGPYKAGFHWADPDVDAACDLMRQVESSREAAGAVGQKARIKVGELLNPATIAASVQARLEELGLWNEGPFRTAALRNNGPARIWKLAGKQVQFNDALPAGVNLLGYFESEKGSGEGARSNLRIVRATGLPYCVNNKVDLRSSNVERVAEESFADNPYLVNLLTLNADVLPEFSLKKPLYLKGHYNIAYWAWELPEFPPEWATSFGYVDEIWTPSRFTRDSVATLSPIPVHVVPHCLEIDNDDSSLADRTLYEVNEDVFLFLFIFDFHSFLERKNPLGLIEAYRRAFGKRKDIQLLIKSAHSAEHQKELALLQRAVAGANVRILDAVLSREEKQNLMKAANCYVSLHRSEGFGLTMAEAMMYGKPVIATGYSGNVDFMSDDDSFLVPYRLVTIDKTHGPYKAGYHWADPDLDHACDFMRYVESNRDTAASVGQKAMRRVRELLHPTTIAAGVRSRLEELGLTGEATPLAAASRNNTGR